MWVVIDIYVRKVVVAWIRIHRATGLLRLGVGIQVWVRIVSRFINLTAFMISHITTVAGMLIIKATLICFSIIIYSQELEKILTVFTNYYSCNVQTLCSARLF